MKKSGAFRWFGLPKVYTWEDVRKQILEDMEREGLYIEGLSAGSSIDGSITFISSPAISRIGETNCVSTLMVAPDIIMRAGDTAYVFETKKGEPSGKVAEQEAVHADF